MIGYTKILDSLRARNFRFLHLDVAQLVNGYRVHGP
jgi:hypothetical protein